MQEPPRICAGDGPISEKPVIRMLLSKKPDQPLVTAVELAKEAEKRVVKTAPQRNFGDNVRGHLERGARMRYSNKMGQPNKDFVFIPTGVTTGFLLMAGLGLFAGLPARAQSASSWDKHGLDAQARDDYDKAYEDFRQAHLKKPKDMRYTEHYQSMRFTAANQHVDRGRILRNSGDVDGAINEFARALQIDPGNQAAAQELQITEKPNGGGGPSGPGAAAGPNPESYDEQLRRQQQVKRDIATLEGPVELQPVNDDPVTLHMVEDTKVIYQAIGKAAGLNVIFDPDYTSKRIPVDLTSMSLTDALRVVGTQSGTFWKAVTPNTIFVAQNNRTKRTDLDDLAVETFYLTNVSQQNDANEILVALRNLFDPSTKMFLIASQNAIVMRATPEELILAEKIINDLDRTRPEVVVDVAVLEVNRQLERDIGITLPTSFGLTPQFSNQNVSSSSSTVNTGTSTTSSSSLTLNTLGNLNATNFAVSLTGGQVNALLSDTDTRILQNPRVRATDGQNAVLKIGSKIPVATGSYSAGAAITTASLGVQTQFTYLDVGVNIDITPTVHLDREVSLKLKVEISSQNGSVTISGVTEPIISQRTVNQVIQLKDGEPSILAGLLQQQDSKVVSGTPGLGELPFIKYFFSSQDKTQQTDEIVFLLIPHIVRESILTRENTTAVFTGTGQDFSLRHKSAAKIEAENEAAKADALAYPKLAVNPTSAGRAASAAINTIAADGRPLPAPPKTGAATPPPAPTAGGPLPTVNLAVAPAVATQAVGSTFQVAITASNAHDLYSVPVQLKFDPKVLALVDVDSGELLSRDGQAVALVHRDEGNGLVTIAATRPPNAAGVNGQGTVCTLTFKALSGGDSTLELTKLGAKNSQQVSLPTAGSKAIVHVK
jgi:general secretion pathway protein D